MQLSSFGSTVSIVGILCISAGHCIFARTLVDTGFNNIVSSLEVTDNEVWVVFDEANCTGPKKMVVGQCYGKKHPKMSQASIKNDKISSAFRVL